MSATKYDALISAARLHLNAQRGSDKTLRTDKFWSDDELFNIALRGTTDLWAAVVDLHQEHFLTVDETNVSMAASATQLSGVPTDVFRIYLIEPRDTTSSGSNPFVVFVPRAYNHQEFINARAYPTTSPIGGLNIFFDMTGAGSPQGAPIVLIAPKVDTAMNLRFVYIPVLGVQQYNIHTDNPIPGESDHAIIAWIVSYARAKEREDRSPDPAWMAVYATEKQSLLMRMAPRQEQEAQVVDGIHDSYWKW